MKILLCAATEMEIAPAIEFLEAHKLPHMATAVTGIGLTAATYSITKAIALYQPNLVIQAGIAGSFDKNLGLAEVVTVKSETIGDLGVLEGSTFHSLFDMQLLNENNLPWKSSRLENENTGLLSLSYKEVVAVTVNEISTNPHRIHYYQQKLHAQIETMEGAALHYVCRMEKCSFLQLRSISNFVGERNKSRWKMKEAIANLNAELQAIITKHFIL